MNIPARQKAKTGGKSEQATLTDEPIIKAFKHQPAWAAWLHKHHAKCAGIWMRIARKTSGEASVSYAEALEVALCYGWIDGQRKSDGDQHWLQRFTPRSQRSIWSKVNREKALALIASGRMQAAGLKEVERAKADGRWEAAYDSYSSASVPTDFQAALDAHPAAKAFFATLDSRNRYACLFRIQTAKKAETREKRIRQFTEMLGRGEKLHP